MQRIYNILVSLFGESKQGNYSRDVTQYQFNCPFCADEKGYVDGKYNLEISFEIGKFHCWSCGNAGPISKLIKIKGGKEYYTDYKTIISDIRNNQYYNLDLFKDNTDLYEESYLKLPKTFKKIIINECKDKNLKEYLENRKITQDIIDFYNIGSTTWDEENFSMKNRIIIPSYDSFGDLNYWVGRDFMKNSKRIKYKNCDADKNKIVFQESKIQWDSDIYLVEGAIDCIFFHNAVSMLGKSLKKDTELFNKLYNQANSNIIICLDSDTDIKETKYIYKILNNGRLKGKIKYVRLGTEELPWKDFGEAYEEYGKNGIIKIIKSVKDFNEMELVV